MTEAIDWQAARRERQEQMRQEKAVQEPVEVGLTEDAPADDWPDPVPLPEGQPPVDSFDLDMLPEAWRPCVEDVTDRMQIAPDLPAMALVVEASALIGRQVGIRPKRYDDWLVIPNLYGVGVGRPSLLKTPAIREALKPIHAMADAARGEHEEAMRRHQAELKVHKAAEKAGAKELEKAVKGVSGAAREQLIQQVLEGDDEPEAPVERRFMTNDTTVEKLGELLRDNPRGILVYRDELMGFLRAMEKEGREQDRAFYLEAWDGGGQFTYDRIGRGTIHIPSSVVAIVGATCPGPLQAWVSQRAATGSGDDGLLQRFQVAVWPDHPGDYVNVDRPPDEAARDLLHKSMWSLDAVGEHLATVEVAKLGGNLTTKILRFDDEAQETFDAWRISLERRLREPDLVPAWESHLGKYRSLLPSLALIFHLVDGGGARVGQDAWLRAAAWAEYLETHARRIYDGFLRPHAAPTHALAEKIRTGALTSPFKLRDVYRPRWSNLTTRPEAELAVETLVDANWLSAEEVARTIGRPTVAYHINPKCKRGR